MVAGTNENVVWLKDTFELITNYFPFLRQKCKIFLIFMRLSWQKSNATANIMSVCGFNGMIES